MSRRSRLMAAGVGIPAAILTLACFRPAPPMPALQAGVQTGAGLLERRDFADLPGVGAATHILSLEVGTQRIGVAGSNGTAWLDARGAVTSLAKFPDRYSRLEFVDVERDGTFELLDRGGGWQTVALLDSKGHPHWTYPRADADAVDDIAAGDLDDDGILDFVAGFNGGGGIRRLDRNGQELWRQPGANVWHVEIVDEKGDGQSEILHSDATGGLTLRDASGTVLRTIKPADYVSQFSILKSADTDSRIQILSAVDGGVQLIGLGGQDSKTLMAPDCQATSEVRGVLIRFSAERPVDLAVLATHSGAQNSSLYLFDEAHHLVYHENLDQPCEAIAAAAAPSGRGQRLLIGGNGKIWEYALKK